MQFISVTNARAELSNLVETAERVVITKAGQPEAVLLPLADYQALIAMQTLLRDPRDLEEIQSAHRQVLSGDLSETELVARKTELTPSREATLVANNG